MAVLCAALALTMGVSGCDGSGSDGKGSTVKTADQWKDPDYRAQVAYATALKVARQLKPGYEFPAKAKDSGSCELDGYPHNRSTSWIDNLGALKITVAWVHEHVVPWLEADGWTVSQRPDGFSAEKYGVYVGSTIASSAPDVTWGIVGNSGCDY